MAVKSSTASNGQYADEVLVTRLAQGDAGALEILYDRYAPLVLGIALKIVGDRAAAETVLQETFWRLWKDPSPSQAGSIPSWLFRTARRLAVEAVPSNGFK